MLLLVDPSDTWHLGGKRGEVSRRRVYRDLRTKRLLAPSSISLKSTRRAVYRALWNHPCTKAKVNRYGCVDGLFLPLVLTRSFHKGLERGAESLPTDNHEIVERKLLYSSIIG